MHDHNVSFRLQTTGISLAPVYDMLPMAYAPLRGAGPPTVSFAPKLPLPAEREAWREAADAAAHFWSTAADDTRISGGFRAICAANLEVVRRTVQLEKST